MSSTVTTWVRLRAAAGAWRRCTLCDTGGQPQDSASLLKPNPRSGGSRSPEHRELVPETACPYPHPSLVLSALSPPAHSLAWCFCQKQFPEQTAVATARVDKGFRFHLDALRADRGGKVSGTGDWALRPLKQSTSNSVRTLCPG